MVKFRSITKKQMVMVTMLISWGRCNKASLTIDSLETIEVCFLPVLEVRGPKSRCW